MSVTTTIFDKNGTPVMIDGIRSEYTSFFRLVHAATELLIDEPVNWGDADRVLDRDDMYHGFHYEYISAETPLLFTCDHGRHLIEEVYNSEGGDGVIYLQYGITDGASLEVVEYEGRLNLNTYDDPEEGVMCQVERKSLHEVVQSRWDSVIDLFSTKSLDDTTIATISAKQLVLHSMAIRERYITTTENKDASEKGLGKWQISGATNFCIIPPTLKPSIDEIKYAQPQTVQIVPGINETHRAFAFESGGRFRVDVSMDMEFNMIFSRKFGFGSFVIEDIQVSGVVDIWRADGFTIDTFLLSGDFTQTIDARETGNVSFSGSLSQSIDILAGDKMFVYVFIYATELANVRKLKFVEFPYVNFNSFSLKIEGATQANISAAKGITIGEAVLQALRSVTGLNDPLRADMLGIADFDSRISGSFANYFLTNGFYIRGFDPVGDLDNDGIPNYLDDDVDNDGTNNDIDTDDDNDGTPDVLDSTPIGQLKRPFNTSLSELFTSLDALAAIGMQYDENDDGQFVKVMPAKDFYTDNEIIYIESNSEYKESADNNLSYNQIEIGFEKYINDPVAIGNLDEYNTRHEYQTPIRTERKKYSKLSKLIMSGYAIEQTRRVQFADKPNDSTQFDDDNFLISFIPGAGNSLTASMTFNGIGTNNYIALGIGVAVPAWIVVGMALQISGSLVSNGVFTVLKIDVANRHIIVLENINTWLFPGSATISAYNYIGKAEKDEAFDSVSNLFGSETAYNLRRTPKRMLITHAPFILSGLKYKAPTDKIKSTFVKNNGLLTTKLKNTDPYPLGDIDFADWTENADVALEDLQDGVRMFSPERISFKCRLSKAELNYIRRACLGKLTEGLPNYGYISTNNNKGEKVSGYLMQIIYKENSEECRLILRKK